MSFFEAKVSLNALIDPSDILNGLNDNDESVLGFICQLLALSSSVELRDNLINRLTNNWEDSDYIEVL